MSLLCWEKKQEFKYKDLLQHASGVGKGSANRSAQQKANHLALGKYLETDLACEAEPIQRPALPQAVNQPLHQQDLYVWFLDEQEKLSSELEEKKRKLDSWSRDLNKREALTDQEKKKLEEDNKKVMYIIFFGL